MDIDIECVDKLKVAELRALLASHELDTKGTKPILVTRLKSYLESLPPKTGESTAKPDAEAETKEEAPAAEDEDDDEEPMEEEEAPAKAEAPAAAVTPKKEVTKEEPAKAVEASKEGAEETVKEAETPKADGDATKTPDKADDDKRGKKRKREDEPFVVNEDEPEIPDDFMCLDWQNSDLTFKINKETFLAAEPFHVAAWGYCFSSARATHGFTSGKIAFEAKWTANLEVKLEDVENPSEMRVGWTVDEANLQAGESPNSYAISNFGKKANDSNFEDFEECKFNTEDVITAMVDFSEAAVSFSFAKNGETLGEVFSVPKSDLAGKVLFPHVSCRNVKVEVNFGKNKDETVKENFFALLEGYTMAGNCVDTAQRSANPRVEKREDCEMIMLIGLPASGKSTWANKHAEENPEKRYNIIGTSILLDRMKVDGEPRKKHMGTKWDQLISKSTKCVQDMLRLASQRRRNFIVDQTNVFANAQKRKVRPFEGMQRKAIVIVPSEEDFKARTEAQEKAECKDVPDNAVMEMKANFTLPEESKEDEGEEKGEKSPFKEIIFTELQREEAAKIVEEYNKDAKEKGFGKKHENQPKRRRGNNQNGMRGMRGNMRNMRGMRGNMRGNMRGFIQRGGFQPRGMMRGGPMRPMGGPPRGMRGMPFGMGPQRGGNMGGGMRGGMVPNRGGNMGGGPRGGMGMGNRGGQGQKFGGGGGPAPWGAPSPWQQQPQRPQRPQGGQGGWGSPWGGQGGGGGGGQMSGGQGNPWGGNQQQGNNFGGGGGGGGYGNQQQRSGGGGGWGAGGNQGYPGSQNWGGFR